MTKSRVIVFTPGNAVTGGPEAAHQLVDSINRLETNRSFICYTPLNKTFLSPKAYSKYRTPLFDFNSLQESDVLIIPEIFPKLFDTLKNRKILWWLSVDNAPRVTKEDLAHITLHCVQSEYANSFVRNFEPNAIVRLSDYIDPIFFEPKFRKMTLPKLVFSFKGELMQEQFLTHDTRFEVARIGKGGDRTREDIARTLKSSSVYVDFGHAPGKDRLPREAAVSGCIVLLYRAGSARYFLDSPLDDFYKFDSTTELSEKLSTIAANMEDNFLQQTAYRNWIMSEKTRFEAETRNLLDVLNLLD